MIIRFFSSLGCVKTRFDPRESGVLKTLFRNRLLVWIRFRGYTQSLFVLCAARLIIFCYNRIDLCSNSVRCDDVRVGERKWAQYWCGVGWVYVLCVIWLVLRALHLAYTKWEWPFFICLKGSGSFVASFKKRHRNRLASQRAVRRRCFVR